MSWGVWVIERVVGFVPRRAVLGVYGFPRLARALRALLNAAVPAGLSEVSVVAGPLRGTRLLLDLKTEKYLWLGTYEPWVQEAIRRYLRPGQVAWDVGAFIGYHTLLMYRTCGPGRVVALEPDPANRARLEKNLALNGTRDVFVIPAAAGRSPGKAWLKRHGSCTRMAPSGDIACDVVRLDDLLERFPPPRLVKMDIEGGEDDALAGASRLLSEVRPVWVVELHGPPGEAACERLRQADYRLVPIGKGIDAPADLPVGGPAHIVAIP